MTTLLQADIFFFITTIAVILLTVLGSVLAYYLIKILKDLKAITASLKQLADNANEEAQDLWERLQNNRLFTFLLARRPDRRGRTRTKKAD